MVLPFSCLLIGEEALVVSEFEQSCGRLTIVSRENDPQVGQSHA